jgi:hypothetical protein
VSTQTFVSLPEQALAAIAPKKGRPAKHADAAARQKAWRAANAVKTVRLDGKLAATVEALAAQFDCDQTETMNHLLRFALANRNWKTQGMTGWAMSDKRCSTGKRALPAFDSLEACCHP